MPTIYINISNKFKQNKITNRGPVGAKFPKRLPLEKKSTNSSNLKSINLSFLIKTKEGGTYNVFFCLQKKMKRNLATLLPKFVAKKTSIPDK